ncbi:IS66 family transposase [Echinicola soli]|uniref:IS66 family transposase n=1 Tax=Echinicola soli TaxID=2591634 RepID=A0A514CIH5_9BACT|nr:IS66 family transposase [Echinicola soli]QDH79623.1 IS66 family transposase [Echinicola soli]QDH80931.1 IS66 family transposase [Echinicola soli]
MENKGTDYKKLYEEALLTVSEKEDAIADLQSELDKLRRYIFGTKSEKRTGSTDQNQLGIFELGTTKAVQEELSESVSVQEQKPAPKKRAKGTGRMSLPEELEREEIVIEPAESTEGCVRIGEEITEVLEVVPACFYVKRYIRPKYARPNGEGIIIGTLPDRVIEKGIPSESVIAQLTVDKYVYGMPLHRQIDKYSKMGVRIPASSASDWVMRGWEQLRPLWELLSLVVISQKYLQVDETPIKVLDRDHKNGIHKGYMWLYHAPVDRLVLFDYRKGRDRSGPKEMLTDFKGIIQTDGWKVYDSLYGNHPDIHLTFCMAHARRYFVDAVKDYAEQANHVLDEIQQLYALEQRMREEALDWEGRTRERKIHAVPVLERLGKWLEENQYRYRPGSPLGKAIDYARSRWAGLSAYTLHGQMELDNNLVENAVRPLAIGRKAFLFAGSHQAAEMTAAMYSFMASCKKNNVNEFEWLKDVFERIQSHKQKDLYQLLPSNWKQYRPK